MPLRLWEIRLNMCTLELTHSNQSKDTWLVSSACFDWIIFECLICFDYPVFYRGSEALTVTKPGGPPSSRWFRRGRRRQEQPSDLECHLNHQDRLGIARGSKNWCRKKMNGDELPHSTNIMWYTNYFLCFFHIQVPNMISVVLSLDEWMWLWWFHGVFL